MNNTIEEIKGGFGLLSQRKEKIDIDELETKFGIKLPTKYRLFSEFFELGKIEMPIVKKGNEEKRIYGYDFIRDGLFEEKEYKKALNYSNGGIGFEKFKPLKEVFNHRGASGNWIEEGLLPIGLCGDNGILLGYKEMNRDQIFFESRFIYNRKIKLADSIFEFVYHIKVFPIQFERSDILIEKLYKKWGEKNWRIEE